MDLDIEVNEDLVSGLLTALNQFTVVEFKQPIESIDMGGLRWSYLSDKESTLMFIAADAKETTGEMLRSRLNVIMQEFLQQYIKDKAHWKANWNGNIDIFAPFKNVIDEYYTQWKAAEGITSIAEFFDILGVFQQILNLVVNVIEGHTDASTKGKIYDQIEKMFNLFSNHQYVKENTELKKISFSRDAGFNIISINPANCDMLFVERQIIRIIKIVVDIIKKEVGPTTAYSYFVDENIFDYILNNLGLMEELNLEKFLLQVFLGK